MDICYSLTYFGKILFIVIVIVFLLKLMEEYIG